MAKLYWYSVYSLKVIKLNIYDYTWFGGGSRGWPALLGIRSGFRTGETTILSISITNLTFLKNGCGPTSGDTVRFVGWIPPPCG